MPSNGKNATNFFPYLIEYDNVLNIHGKAFKMLQVIFEMPRIKNMFRQNDFKGDFNI